MEHVQEYESSISNTALLGFMYPAYNGTGVEILVHCKGAAQVLPLRVQWVLRSSPCYREFTTLSTMQR